MCLPVKPFKIEREWEHAGLKCAVVQATEGGHRCGYVRVPLGHPMHGKPYDDIDISVHGGLTFGDLEPCAHDDGQGYWLGFDCAHAGDCYMNPVFSADWSEGVQRIWHIVMDGRDKFRKEHPNMEPSVYREHYWSEAEVVAETERLAEQLVAMAA